MELATILPLAILAAAAPAGNTKAPDLVFLCIGQSNMSGRAPMKEGDDAVMEGVFLLNAEGTWEPARPASSGRPASGSRSATTVAGTARSVT